MPLQAGLAETITDKEGRTLEAEIIEINDTHLKIKRSSDGRNFDIPINTLNQSEIRRLKVLFETPPSLPDEITWPKRVNAPDYDIEIVKEDNKTKEYVYRSSHFEFVSNVKLARNVVRGFSDIFEATYEVIARMPISWNPILPEEGYYRTQLFETRSQYLEAGGLEGSGGVFYPGKNLIMIPISSLGVEKTSSSYSLRKGSNPGTLKHEITHQLTRHWRLPVWVSEGIAEYIEHLPYDDGTYRYGNDLDLEDLNLDPYSTGEIAVLHPETLMNISHSQWNGALASNTSSINYRSSFLLIYYFIHLEGTGQAKRLREYLEYASQNPRHKAEEAAMLLLNGRSFEELSLDFKRKIEREAGDITFPHQKNDS